MALAGLLAIQYLWIVTALVNHHLLAQAVGG